MNNNIVKYMSGCLLLTIYSCSSPKPEFTEEILIYANTSETDKLQIQAVYKDSLYQVFYDFDNKRQYIQTKNGLIYLKRKEL